MLVIIIRATKIETFIVSVCNFYAECLMRCKFFE